MSTIAPVPVLGVRIALTVDALVRQVQSVSNATRVARSRGSDAKDPAEQDFSHALSGPVSPPEQPRLCRGTGLIHLQPRPREESTGHLSLAQITRSSFGWRDSSRLLARWGPGLGAEWCTSLAVLWCRGWCRNEFECRGVGSTDSQRFCQTHVLCARFGH